MPHHIQHDNDWTQLEIALHPDVLAHISCSLDGSVYLKSAADSAGHDIFSCLPERVLQIAKDSLHQVNECKGLARALRLPMEPSPILTPVPFASGLLGYVSYEAGAQMGGVPVKNLAESALPAIHIGYYSWSYVYDHGLKRGWLTFSPSCAESTRQKVLNLLLNAPHQDADRLLTCTLKWRASLNVDLYAHRFERAKRYIEAGDVYQINLAQMFVATSDASPAKLFDQLSKTTSTPYSALINPGQNSRILSFSPEQFIAVQGQKVLTRPIKGTLRNRGERDEMALLLRSEKNRAENVMIVDLMRNDLSKVCKTHSVKVPLLCQGETFKNVHHLVSTIEGELRDECDALDAFFACLPGGSITGAPKKRAMEIIDELELSGRDAYCGSAFYYSDSGNFDSNILIRTLVQSGHQWFCWGGGGIVADSVLAEEYAESLIKVQNLTGIAPD